MKKWLRRTRGIIGTALTWGVGWSLIGLAGGVPVLNWGIPGAIAGGGFAVALAIAGRRRTLREISVGSAAGWGALGTVGAVLLAMPLLLLMMPALKIGPVLAVLAVLGAGSGAGTLAIAKRAEDREVLEAGEEVLGLKESWADGGDQSP